MNWQGCYDLGWQGLITAESFSHPAKVSRGLIRRIYKHAFEEGWLKHGDTVLDPFGGIGGTALDAMWNRCHWVGVELEPRFVALGEQNIALWHRKFGSNAGWGTARIIQGDSRNLGAVVQSADCVVSSPPYAHSMEKEGGIDPALSKHTGGPHSQMNRSDTRYGVEPGQLGAMPEERFDAVIGSPPFSQPGCQPAGNMPSTPVRSKQRAMGLEKPSGKEYGATPGQLQQETGDTFWAAAREIVAQCYAILKPSGKAIFVCKDFVRKGKRVPFSDQWQALCEAEGFRLVCRHRAMLVAEHGQHGDFFQEAKQLTTERKSFFRRLAEKKGSPAINWEDVICLERT